MGAEPLDALDALERARAIGMRRTILVAHAVRCPEIDITGADPSRLASSAEGGTIVDARAFLVSTTALVDAIALLGPPALCEHMPGSPSFALHLAPRSPIVHGVLLSLREGELQQIVMDFEPPTRVDFARLAATWGVAGAYPRAPEGPHPGADRLDLRAGQRTGILAVGRVDHGDPLDRSRVHRLAFTRFGE